MYSRKTRIAIRKAFGALSEFVACSDMTMPAMVESAHRLERSDMPEGVNKKAFAEAVVIKAFLQGYYDHERPAYKLTGSREGWLKAFLCGARVHKHFRNNYWQTKIHEQLKAAIVAHENECAEFMDSM